MKTKLLLIAIILLSLNSFGQKFKHLEDNKLKKIEDYAKYDKELLDATNYILSNPIDKNDVDRLYAISFVLRWMDGCKYTFMIHEEAIDLSKKDEDLLSVYLAAMTNYVLNNKSNAENNSVVRLETLNMLLDYIENPKFKIKQTKKIKKFLKARKENELSKLLK